MYSTYSTTPTYSSTVTMGEGLTVWMLIAAILAVIGGIVAYCIFIRKKNSYKGFLSWLHEVLNFKTLFIEMIMKIGYAVAAIFVTLFSFGLISIPGLGFLAFLFMLIFGNIGLRLMYEFMMLTLILVRNTTDISKKLGADKPEKPAKSEKKEK